MLSEQPRLLLVAGPNGAGKTTVTFAVARVRLQDNSGRG